jgi:hypothetical protein
LEPELWFSVFFREPEPNWNVDPGFLKNQNRKQIWEFLKERIRTKGLTEV